MRSLAPRLCLAALTASVLLSVPETASGFNVWLGLSTGLDRGFDQNRSTGYPGDSYPSHSLDVRLEIWRFLNANINIEGSQSDYLRHEYISNGGYEWNVKYSARYVAVCTNVMFSATMNRFTFMAGAGPGWFSFYDVDYELLNGDMPEDRTPEARNRLGLTALVKCYLHVTPRLAVQLDGRSSLVFSDIMGPGNTSYRLGLAYRL